MSRRRVYMDLEFTGLHKDTSLVSIGLVNDQNDLFYAEVPRPRDVRFYSAGDRNFFDSSIEPHLFGADGMDTVLKEYSSNDEALCIALCAPEDMIRTSLKFWLEKIGDGPASIEIWADVLGFDWVLFCDIFGHAFNIPSDVYYIPFDLATLMLVKGVDPDVDREEFAGVEGSKHNALHDALVVRACVQKMMEGA